ncbi:MAG: molecular chaperone DnaJ [Planctomycetes bacterium]|nr:molecular chaperone DnaJ [Planctomycetota bacterium]
MTAKRDYYEILGVPKQAALDEIKKSYRQAALKFHPDRNPGDREAESRFKEAAEAYEVLSDTEKRARYDQYGHDGLAAGGFGPRGFSSSEDIFEAFGDIFGDIFGFGRRGGGGRRGPRPGASLRAEVEIDFIEAAKGCERTIVLKRHEVCKTCTGSGAKAGTQASQCATCGGHGQVLQGGGFFTIQTACPKCGGSGKFIKDPCKDCHGEGTTREKGEVKIAIPAGIDTNSRIRVTGQGEPSLAGGERGDLFVDVTVRPHAIFEREGTNLFCEIPVSFTQATLGADIEVATLDEKIALKLPHGTPSGQLFRLRGHGLPDIEGGRKGDLVVRVVIDVPRSLTKQQEDLLREFAKTEKVEVKPRKKSLLDKIKDIFES